MGIGAGELQDGDEVAGLARLLEAALHRLSHAADDDAAARIAAQAWALLQVRRPDEARRFEIALHRLTHASRNQAVKAGGHK